jgi:hypothetical protein
MNIVFCFIDGGEETEDFVKTKLMELHYAHPTITGAQVNFCREDGPANERCCLIDLMAYETPFRISRTGVSFQDAALKVLTELNEKVEEHAVGVTFC